MLTWSEALFDALLSGVGCTSCGVTDCSPWRVRVIPGVGNGGVRLDDAYLHNSRTLQNDQPVPVHVGSILEVTSTSSSGGLIALFVTVVTTEGTGQQDSYGASYAGVGASGWIASFRTTYESGIATGLPYVLPEGGGRAPRDGSPESAVAYAMSWIGTGAAEWGGNPPDEASKCLGFVKTCYGIASGGATDRCPALGGAGSAYAAHEALNNLGLIKQGTPPPGSMLFWDGSAANGWYGHVAIMGADGNVITSGAVSSHPEDQTNNPNYHPDVWSGSLDAVRAWTGGAFQGYATVDDLFLPGTWGGIPCVAPEET